MPRIFPGAKSAPPSAAPEISEDEFSEDDGDEKESVMKSVKFPEIEGIQKVPGAAIKVTKCLEKRINCLRDMIAKFEGDGLTKLQKTFLGGTHSF